MGQHVIRLAQLIALSVALLLVGACSDLGPRPGLKGQLLWDFKIGGTIYSTPSVENGVIYFSSIDNYVYALDADTGELRWRYRTGDRVRSSPTVSDGVVYVGSLDGYFYALDAETGGLRWQYQAEDPIWFTPAVAGGVVFGATHPPGVDGQLFALDAASGLLLWQFRTRIVGHSAPAVIDGVVYIASLDRKVYALDAGTGEVLWSYKVDSTIGFSPVVKEDIVYLSIEKGGAWARCTNWGAALEPPIRHSHFLSPVGGRRHFECCYTDRRIRIGCLDRGVALGSRCRQCQVLFPGVGRGSHLHSNER